MPRGDATGTASFVDHKNHLLGEVHFGKVAGHENESLLQRPDAVHVTIYEFSEPQRDSDAHEAQGQHSTLEVPPPPPGAFTIRFPSITGLSLQFLLI